MDLRSLALLRICVGMLVVIDLIQRSSDLLAHYTDYGVLPRAALIEQMYSRWLISIHLINGTWQIQALLFAIAAVFGLGLIVGYKTRLTTIVSWFFLISLDARNPVILQGGDVLLRVMLFWGIFLPWGSRYSVDHVLQPPQHDPGTVVVSWATCAYLMQIVFVYWFSVLLKTGAEWRTEGTAVYYALSIDQFATPLAHFLLNFPLLLKVLSFGVLGFEFLGPLLLFSPVWTGPIRTAVVLSLFVLHLGFWLCLDIGLFGWISAMIPVGLLPSWFWQKALALLHKAEQKQLTIYYDQDCSFCERSARLIKTLFLLPNTALATANSDRSVELDMRTHNSWVVIDERGNRHFGYRGGVIAAEHSPIFRRVSRLMTWKWCEIIGQKVYGLISNHRKIACGIEALPHSSKPAILEWTEISNLLVVFFLLYVFFWNLATIPDLRLKVPERFRFIGQISGLEQRWNMFAPYPLKDDGWYVIPGQLKNGTTVDLFRGGEITWKKPAHVSAEYKNYRWRKYMMNLWSRDNRKYRPYYAQYLCRDWNSRHAADVRLEELEIYFVLEKTLPDYDYFTPEKILLLKHRCGR